MTSKISERLLVCVDYGKGLLQRLYNSRRDLASSKRPSILGEDIGKRLVRLASKDFPSVPPDLEVEKVKYLAFFTFFIAFLFIQHNPSCPSLRNPLSQICPI